MTFVRRACLLCLICSSALAGAAGPSASPGHAAGDDLLIVDCLLPGQIRRLGTASTYVSARQPARTSARDCRIRGGEYASHDRADYRTSLAVWLPAAREGDDEARVNVGTIFERGLGRAPDYAAAAHWYALAAESGHVEAQLKLAHLYEVGLGVTRDSERSLYWYRQAMGLEDASLDLVPARSQLRPERALERLSTELGRLEHENERLRVLLEAARQRLDAGAGPAGGNTARIPALEQALAERTTELAALKARYESASAAYRAVLGERDPALSEAHAPRRQGEAGDDNARAAMAAQAATIGELRRELRHKAQALSEQDAHIRSMSVRLAELEGSLQAAAAQRAAVQTAAADRLLAGPAVTIIDPRLPATRGLVEVTVPAGGRQQLVGRVEAPAGLLSLTVNDEPLDTNSSGVFLTQLPVRGSTGVTVKAIDHQGKRADVSFELHSVGTPAPAPVLPAERYEDMQLGRYHALVIGNNAYRHLPRLKTAVHDARAMHRLLEERYGFDSRLLIDANRYDILSALNELRERLTSEDNLLVYYAGHGELDEVNMRGHWLPVDAESENTANWISNVAVTDVLNVMRARHVMLIVDSCYSGSLTRSSVTSIATAMTDAERRNWIATMSRKRARLVLSSGGLAPVLDAGGGRHSVFARALLEVLEENELLLDGRELYQQVAARVAYAASSVQFEQVPEFGPIRHAGHEAGAFFLVPGN